MLLITGYQKTLYFYYIHTILSMKSSVPVVIWGPLHFLISLVQFFSTFFYYNFHIPCPSKKLISLLQEKIILRNKTFLLLSWALEGYKLLKFLRFLPSKNHFAPSWGWFCKTHWEACPQVTLVYFLFRLGWELRCLG